MVRSLAIRETGRGSVASHSLTSRVVSSRREMFYWVSHSSEMEELSDEATQVRCGGSRALERSGQAGARVGCLVISSEGSDV